MRTRWSSSIRVPNGPLTSRLGRIQIGDEILVGKKPTGTLVHDSLLDGDRLYLVARLDRSGRERSTSPQPSDTIACV